jgi:DNA sulfur modification protein DndB
MIESKPQYTGMKLSFPAMHGVIGKREYYVAMVRLALVPKLFKFKDWAELPPEQRAQRVIQKSRIPEITQYILANEDGYLFSSLTASYNCEPTFTPIPTHNELGVLEMPFEADLIINDGQHRRAAIEEALKENPTLGQESISVVLFPWEDLDRVQQMFSDLNRTARKTSKSLDILYNHRDLMSQVALTVSERLEVFRRFVDKDRISLPLRSPKLFTLSAIYDGTAALLEAVVDGDYDEKLAEALEFWEGVADNILEWGRVKDGDLKPVELRQEYINTHAVILWALGAMGRTLISTNPTDWRTKLRALRAIDWRRTNREWQGIAMTGSDVVNRRQSRMDTSSFLKQKLGLPLTPAEDRSLRSAGNPSLVMNDLRQLIGKARPTQPQPEDTEESNETESSEAQR